MPVSPATKVLCSVLLAGALMPACAGCENPAVQGPGSSGLPGLSGTDAGTTSNPADGFASVVIEPANPVVTTRAGVAAAQAFSLVGVKADGSRVPVATAEWSGDHDLLGTISAQGNFSITGAAAGSVRVRGLIRPSSGTPLVADTTLTVKMTAVVITPGTPMDAATQFENAMPAADTSGRVALLYPLHEAVMPRNVPPADIQWEGGEQGDLFRVTLKKSNITLEAYLEHTGSTFNDHWLVETAAWRTLAASDPSEKLQITVDRLHDGSVSIGEERRIKFARGGIYGLVYYWALEPGRILRVDAETAVREDFMPSPPRPPAGGRYCVACHAISPNGRYLAGQLGEGTAREGTVFDLTADLTPDPAPALFDADQVNWGPSSFNPDATRLVVSSLPGLGLVDPRSGQSVNATGLPSGNANHPVWSPDGTAIAYVGSNEQWSWAFSSADLMLVPVTGPDTFGTPTKLLDGDELSSSTEGGEANMRPTWSPDSRMLAFAHGRQQVQTTDTALYVMQRDATRLQRLNQATGGNGSSEGGWPTFSPFVTAEDGGELYYWLAFYSRRDYGNAEAGTKGRDLRQLWVTAVRASAAPGEDPSFVPYWLPGQETDVDNIAGYWATPACRQNQDTCAGDADCCSGTCFLEGESNPGRCVPPETGECRAEGQTCGGTGDCCMGLTCTGNVCSPPQMCVTNGAECTADADCCSGACVLQGESGSVCEMQGGNPGDCRQEARACTSDAQCCTPLLCLDGFCGSVGG